MHNGQWSPASDQPGLSLRLRILIVALLPLLVAVGLFAAYFAHRSVTEAELGLERLGKDTSRHLAEAVAYDLFSGNLTYVKRLLDFELNTRNAQAIGITGGKGWQVVSSHAHLLPPLAGVPQESFWRDGSMLYFSYPVHLPTSQENDPYLDLMGETSHTASYVVVAISRDPIELTRSQVVLTTAGMALLTILLALILAWRLSGGVSRPLHRIIQSVHRLAGGSLSERVDESSLGEIGQLERGVNKMAHALQESQNSLQRKVQEATAELLGQKQAAEAAVLAKSRFLAAASHDLRQPLHAMTLLVSALRERLPDGEPKRLADHIESSASAMESLLNSLLDLSKLDAGIVEAHPECFPLARILENICNQFTPLAKEKGLRLQSLTTKMWAYTDPVLMERILANLISNALRYTDHGRVLVGCRRVRKDWIRLEVWDTGRGILPVHQARIFEEYFQLENPERHRDKGLGLGLAIVSRLARLLGCSIQVRSTLHRGSCFHLQIARCHPRRLSAREEFTASPSFSLPLEHALVAFIDDDLSILEAMVEVFDQWGVSLAAGEDAEQVRAELIELGRRPDIILSDFRLNDGRNGIEAVAVLRAAFGPDIPALLLTGDTAPETIQAINDSGLPVLHKPLKPAKLRAFLSHLLAGNTSQVHSPQ